LPYLRAPGDFILLDFHKPAPVPRKTLDKPGFISQIAVRDLLKIVRAPASNRAEIGPISRQLVESVRGKGREDASETVALVDCTP
jgi:hypothetical protein